MYVCMYVYIYMYIYIYIYPRLLAGVVVISNKWIMQITDLSMEGDRIRSADTTQSRWGNDIACIALISQNIAHFHIWWGPYINLFIYIDCDVFTLPNRDFEPFSISFFSSPEHVLSQWENRLYVIMCTFRALLCFGVVLIANNMPIDHINAARTGYRNTS